MVMLANQVPQTVSLSGFGRGMLASASETESGRAVNGQVPKEPSQRLEGLTPILLTSLPTQPQGGSIATTENYVMFSQLGHHLIRPDAKGPRTNARSHSQQSPCVNYLRSQCSRFSVFWSLADY